MIDYCSFIFSFISSYNQTPYLEVNNTYTLCVQRKEIERYGRMVQFLFSFNYKINIYFSIFLQKLIYEMVQTTRLFCSVSH